MTVITSPRYKGELDRAEKPSTLRLEYVPEPASQSHYVTYLRWLRHARRLAAALHDRGPFDLAHHLTYANAWLPLCGAHLGIPFVVGPLGGGPSVPFSLYPELGPQGTVREGFRRAVRTTLRAVPPSRADLARASVVLVANGETGRALPRTVQSRARVEPNNSLETSLLSILPPTRRHDRPHAVMAGRLRPWKGGSVAVRALVRLPKWHLTIIGEGGDRHRLEKIAARLNVSDRVRFVPWCPQADLWQAVAQADAVLVPSLRDDGPSIVLEALALGTPVVAFRQGLAAQLDPVDGLFTVSRSSRRAMIDEYASLVDQTLGRRAHLDRDMSPSRIVHVLAQAYDEALATVPQHGTTGRGLKEVGCASRS